MAGFADLWEETADLWGGEQQAAIRRLLPERAAERGIHVWNPGDSIAAKGVRILFGVTEWNRKDLEFLDSLIEQRGDAYVEIFLFADCRSQEDIAVRIPGIGPVLQPPALGVWRDGVLVERVHGGAVWGWLAKR